MNRSGTLRPCASRTTCTSPPPWRRPAPHRHPGDRSCLPGAKLVGQDGDTYEGTMKVKVGPIVAEYSGTATVVEMNETDRTVKLTASGRDKRRRERIGRHLRLDGRGRRHDRFIATDLKVAGCSPGSARNGVTSPRNCSGSSPSASRPNCSRLRPSPSPQQRAPRSMVSRRPPATARLPPPSLLLASSDDDDVLDLMDAGGGVLRSESSRLSPVSSPSSSI